VRPAHRADDAAITVQPGSRMQTPSEPSPGPASGLRHLVTGAVFATLLAVSGAPAQAYAIGGQPGARAATTQAAATQAAAPDASVPRAGMPRAVAATTSARTTAARTTAARTTADRTPDITHLLLPLLGVLCLIARRQQSRRRS
jgi:hypothetical protein